MSFSSVKVYQVKLAELLNPIENFRIDMARFQHAHKNFNDYFRDIAMNRSLGLYISNTDPEVCILFNDTEDMVEKNFVKGIYL